jgi:ribonuclease E
MADTTSVPASTPVSGADIARAEEFTLEPFVHEGEDAATALAQGTARRAALEAALAEIDAGLEQPSIEWRRQYSLMLGLERLLSQEEPHLADGATLTAHQVDALSGTLAALMAEVLSPSRTNGAGPPEQIEELPTGEEELEGDEEIAPDEEPVDWDAAAEDDEAELAEAPEDPNAARRFWFEHATGSGKTVAAMGFVEASRTGGILILTHRRNLVDQFNGELRDRGYKNRVSAPLLKTNGEIPTNGPVTVETYQWFVRNAGKISDAYTIVICDEAHTALGEKTSASIRRWQGPTFIGMTATGALIARHVTDLFPTQTSRFDLAQAARRGVIAPLRCVRIPPGVGVRTIAKVPLRRGEVDQDFDQEELAALLDQGPFNAAVADLYRVRFKDLPGVVYAAGVRHAYNVAKAFQDAGIRAKGVSGETPKRELTRILAAYERGEIDVLVNAQLLAEGWNSPRATVCMHLAPTASKRIYQQRVGRVTRRNPGKEAGIVVDFVHPATTHDDPVVTLHSLLDRDVYRGGAIVVGPVRRGRGRRLRVERRVLPVTADPDRRAAVFERELWRIAVEHLSWSEQHVWAALAGARVASNNWRRAKAMLHFDSTGELRRRFVITCLQRNRNSQLRIRALQEIATVRDAEAFDEAVDIVGGWSRDERREGVKVLLQALCERPIGRRDQATAWIWRLAEYTREVHEEYAAQRWPETKRLLGLLVNSSGGAHARNARRLVQASRKQDRRLAAALLAAALAHTPEAEEVLRGARTRMARKPSALARELLRNFPKGRRRRGGRRRKSRGGNGAKAQERQAQRERQRRRKQRGEPREAEEAAAPENGDQPRPKTAPAEAAGGENGKPEDRAGEKDPGESAAA